MTILPSRVAHIPYFIVFNLIMYYISQQYGIVSYMIGYNRYFTQPTEIKGLIYGSNRTFQNSGKRCF